MSADPQHTSPSNTNFDLSAFVRGFTHEIANPLNAVVINCDLLKMIIDRGDLARAKETLGRLTAASGNCAALMRGLQGFGAALRRNPPLLVEVAVMLDSAVHAFVLQHSGQRPSIEIDGGGSSVHVDRIAVEHAIVALLRNSVEAGSDRIELRCHRERSSVVIVVRDNGAGFRADDHERFEAPFYTTHRGASNMGLGLTLAREVLRVNDGSLRIVPVETGAQVEIRLPEAIP